MALRSWRRPLYLSGLVVLLFALALAPAASARPSACQVVPRATVAKVLGLPNVSTYSVEAPYQCGLVAWRKSKPTIPGHTVAADKRLDAELRAGQIALLHVALDDNSEDEVGFQSLSDPPRTTFSLPLFGADGMEAGGEVLRNISEVGAGWWWWDDPSSPTRQVRQAAELRIVQYHRSFGQLEKELSRVAAIAVPRAGGS